MALTGCGWTVGAQHNHNLESWFVHAAGLKVVMPSTADDFKGLLKSAIRDDNPVLFFTDMVLGYQTGDVPDGEHLVPLGSAGPRAYPLRVESEHRDARMDHEMTAQVGMADAAPAQQIGTLDGGSSDDHAAPSR